MSEIVPCVLCDSPVADSQCTNRSCLRGEFTSAESAEYQRWLASPAFAARELVRIRRDYELQYRAFESQVSALQIDRAEAKVMVRELTKRCEVVAERAAKMQAALEAFKASIFFADDWGGTGGAWFNHPCDEMPNAKNARELHRLLNEALGHARD